MQSQFLYKIACLSFALFFASASLFLCSSSFADQPSPSFNNIPSLLQSLEFENSIQYCNVKIPLERQEIKERLEKEMLLALWDRPQVILWLKRASRYFPVIENILKKNGLPSDLKYVPIIESALRPHAGSSKGAIGFWQFLRSTGRRYGLRIDSMVDERRNIIKSTQAACRYLKALKQQFGSFMLALSAYNMGEYGLLSEIKAQKTNNFFSLYLPLETQRYLFKLITAKLIFENQKKYGFHLKPSDLYPDFTFDKIHFKSDFLMPIVLVAKASGISFKNFKAYNPELRGYHLGKGSHTLLIPQGRAEAFNKNFAAQYKTWEKTYKKRVHLVEKGDSLIKIAEKYQISLSFLLKLNNLSITDIIHPGDRLVIQ